MERKRVPELKRMYEEEVVPKLMKELNYSNPLQVPRLYKVVLNMGVGNAKENMKTLESAVYELSTITGQKAVVTRARKSIAGFKIRQGDPVGVRVTLRKTLMYEFLYRLIHVALPRVRDFKGLSTKGFDGRGNYNFGIREDIIFPEVDYNKIDRPKGLNVTVVTTAETDEEAYRLLKALGFPFREV